MRAWINDRTKRVLKDVASFHGSPTQVARGAAIGTLIAFTPTMGLQIVMAVIASTALRANRAIAVAMVWITNPATAVPIYTFCYAQGRRFTGGPSVMDVSRQLAHTFRRLDAYEFWELFDRGKELLTIGGEVLWPMTVGGIIVGLVCAVPAYVLTLLLVRIGRTVVGHHHHHTDVASATPHTEAHTEPTDQPSRRAA